QGLGSYAVLAGDGSIVSSIVEARRIGEAQITEAQLLDIPCRQSSDSGPDVAGERLGAFSALKHISLQHLDQRLRIAGFQRPDIGGLPPIERLADAPHLLRDRQVADPHLAQVVVHVLAEQIENRLPPGRAVRRIIEPPQQQNHVQQDHFKATVHRIGHPEMLVKGLGSRLCHDGAIERGNARVVTGAAKELEYHRDSSMHRVSSRGSWQLPPCPLRQNGDTSKWRWMQRYMGMQQQAARSGRLCATRLGMTLAALLALSIPLAGCFSETYQK